MLQFLLLTIMLQVRVDHQRCNLLLLMYITLPVAYRHVDADRLLVRANRSGTRLTVVCEQYCHHVDEDQLNEQFTLPVTVDPYAVTARLEHDGVLVIEAPVVVL